MISRAYFDVMSSGSSLSGARLF